MNKSRALVEAKNLKKYFPIKTGLFNGVAGYVRAVDDVSFSIEKGKVLGIVGESGCGKSTTARVLMDLLPATDGSVFFDGIDVSKMTKEEKKDLRKRTQIIFQDPFSSLNPRMTVYDLVGEGMIAHKTIANRKEMKEKVEDLMLKCGLFPDQATRYPHQFSGGQRQRIGIARALAADPDFVVCDEAVSALDVSIQAQIINLLKELQENLGLTYLFVSHDLNVVEFISDEVAVMYLGQIVEKAPTEELFEHHVHPYTEALLSAVPAFMPEEKAHKKRIILEGDIPSPSNPPKGCRFSTRCKYATEKCFVEQPEYKEVSPGHFASCHMI